MGMRTMHPLPALRQSMVSSPICRDRTRLLYLPTRPILSVKELLDDLEGLMGKREYKFVKQSLLPRKIPTPSLLVKDLIRMLRQRVSFRLVLLFQPKNSLQLSPNWDI
jgi:hypothetical protein